MQNQYTGRTDAPRAMHVGTDARCPDCNDQHPRPRCQRYEGWTNRETWTIAYAIDNDQRRANHWRSQALAAVNAAQNNPDRWNADPIQALANLIEGDQHYLPGQCYSPGDLAHSLLTDALAAVNWREVADHLIAKAQQ